MKRFLALMLSLALAFSTVCIPIATAATSSADKEELLKLVGVWEENADLDKTVTKGEFALMLSKVAFGFGVDLKSFSIEKSVADVPATSKYHDAVAVLYSKGFLTTDKYGCFYPNSTLTYTDAYEMIMRTVGYSEDIMRHGETFESLAVKKGIVSGAVGGNSNEITVLEAYTMIYNMLKCDVTDLKYLKYNTSETNLVFMTARLRIYEVSGIVTDDGKISMYGDSLLTPTELKLDNLKTLINETGKEDLFGKNIYGYCVYETNDNSYHLMSAYERSGKNTITQILSENIDSFENRTYSFYTDEFSSSLRHIKVPKDAVIVYNERTLKLDDEFETQMFVPETGVVKLIDNDGDGTVDIVKIENYTTQIVRYAKTSDEIIYFKNDQEALDLSGKEYNIYDTSGQKTDLSKVSQNAVLSILESIDGEHFKIVVSLVSQTATVATYSESSANGESSFITTTAGGKYILSDYAKSHYDIPEINSDYKFYFDAFDKVVGYTKDTSNSEWRIGYLSWIKLDDESETDESIARIYTSDGDFYIYTVNKYLTVTNADDTVSKYKTEDAAKNVTYTGIIRYKLNEDDLVTNIELPYEYGKKPHTDDRLFCILDTVSSESASNYYTSVNGKTVSIGGSAILTEDTTIFLLPDDRSLYEEYNTGTISMFNAGDEYSLMIYCTDYKSKTAVCAMGKDVFGTSITNERPATVSDVYLYYDEKEAEPIYNISCVLYDGSAAQYYMKRSVYENEIFAIGAGNKEAIKLEAGDIIYLSVNSKSFITKAVVAYDTDQIVTDERGHDLKGAVAGTTISYYSASNTLGNPFATSYYTSGNTGLANTWKFNSGNIRIWSGWVYSYSDGYMLVTNQNPEYGYNPDLTKDDGFLTEAVYYNKGITTVTTIVSKNNVTVAKAVEADIKPYDKYGASCSRVVVTQRAYAQRSICIINEE